MNKCLSALMVAVLIPAPSLAGGSRDDGHHHHHDAHAKDHHQGMHGQAAHSSAVGGAGDAAAVNKTVRVDLLDTMRFTFDAPLELKRGDVVRFIVTNRGQLRHEFSIGSESEQLAHRALMREMPDMVHEDANTVTVEPGGTRELIWRFNGTESVEFACNIPGHAEAGMVATTELQP